MDIQAIIFDKDGTLMKFDSFWIEVSRCAAEELLRRLGREEIHIHFARNAGISAIGVGSSRERLKPYADAVIPDISYLPDVIEGE